MEARVGILGRLGKEADARSGRAGSPRTRRKGEATDGELRSVEKFFSFYYFSFGRHFTIMLPSQSLPSSGYRRVWPAGCLLWGCHRVVHRVPKGAGCCHGQQSVSAGLNFQLSRFLSWAWVT